MAKPKGVRALMSFKPYLTKYKGTIIIALISLVIATSITVLAGLFLNFSIDKLPEDAIEASDYINNLVWMALGGIILLAITQFSSGYHIQKLSAKVSEDIRAAVFGNIINHDLQYIEKQFSGDMQTRIVADINKISGFLSMQIPIMLSAVLSLVGGLAGAIYVSPKLTGLILLAVPFIFLPFIILSKKLQKLGERVQTAISEVGRYSGEVFRSIKIVKAYNQEPYEKGKFSAIAQTASEITIKTNKMQIIISVVVSSTALFGIISLLAMASKDIFAGTMTVGELMAFGYFAFTILKAVGNFVGVISSMNVATGAAQKIFEYFEIKKDQGNYVEEKYHCDKARIEFKNVAFFYPSRPNAQILKGINLVIEAGAQIAIVGSSGAGKSTLVELLLRFYQPQQGEILIDGQNIANINIADLRTSIGFLPQKETLISGNVLENIGYGLAGATPEKISDAAKKAHADGFITELPDGYQTDLAEAGGRLSGGQKQRISLARALIREPRILLLDEPNSALDTESEHFIAESINKWATTNNTTVITIAHRLSTVKHADMIIVMDNGMIVGQGDHETLSANCKVYQNLLNPKSNPNAKVDESEELVIF